MFLFLPLSQPCLSNFISKLLDLLWKITLVKVCVLYWKWKKAGLVHGSCKCQNLVAFLTVQLINDETKGTET